MVTDPVCSVKCFLVLLFHLLVRLNIIRHVLTGFLTTGTWRGMLLLGSPFSFLTLLLDVLTRWGECAYRASSLTFSQLVLQVFSGIMNLRQLLLLYPLGNFQVV